MSASTEPLNTARAPLPGAIHGTERPARLPAAVKQAGLVLVAVLAYFGVRGMTEGNPGSATHNADRVIAVERLLHIDVETRLQHVVVNHPDAVRLLNWIYIFGHWPVIAATLGWLLLRHRETFRHVRNAMALSGGIGLIIFTAFPVAPPRLAGLGLVDTITEHSDAYRVLQPTMFTNQYAAMPSLHVGWNLLITLAILTATRHTWIRWAAITLTVAMDVAVVLTANHYLADGIAGATLATVAWHVTGRWQGSGISQGGIVASVVHGAPQS